MPTAAATPWMEKLIRQRAFSGAWWLFLAPALVLVVYAPVLSYQYVWDDLTYFRGDSIYRDPAQFWASLRQAFVMNANYFRPLTVLTFLLEMKSPQQAPALSHGINLAFHAVNVFLVGWLGFLLSRGREDRGAWAFALAMLYGFHAAMTESVAFVSSRFDLMLTSFLLLALAADLTLRRSRLLRTLCVSSLFFCAALTKEMAACFVLLYPLWSFLTLDSPEDAPEALEPVSRGNSWKKGMTPVLGGLLAAGSLYLVLRRLCMGYLLDLSNQQVLDAGSPAHHLLLVLKSMGRYVALALWPFALVRPIHFTPLPVPLGDGQAWVVLAGLLGLLVLGLRSRRSASHAPLWFALPLLATLPVLNLAPLSLTGGAFAADRYLTFPLALLVLALGAVLPGISLGAEGPGMKARSRLLLTGLLLGCAAFSAFLVRFAILPHWQDEMALWTWAESKSPESPLPHNNLAGEYCARGDYARGLQEVQLALAADPDYADALSNQGVALIGLGRVPEAIASWEKALSLRPADAVLWTNLGAAYRGAGRFEDSLRALKDHALVLNPRDGYAVMNVGLTYRASGQLDLARTYLERSIPLLPPDEAALVRSQLQNPSSPQAPGR